ncbi:hypothetical protein D9611_009634 [Ephemerocybe angulata]|uniref:DUF6533 domain-containing protein n=1 Tax=Ephemerocybe angulata TaxID=980116 RepID=A0A8H5C805_9AGAR|nr:hypothetical protein D9611_009634 [Tulosesus angulatus]
MLPLEVELIWPSPFGIVKALFFLNRYMCIDIIASYFLRSIPNAHVCYVAFIVTSIFSFVGIAVSEAIMFVRLFALIGRRKRWGYLLGAQFVIVHAASIAILSLLISGVRFQDSHVSLIPCIPITTVTKDVNAPITVFFAVVMANELIIFMVMVWIGLQKHRETRSALLQLFYRDGAFFFLVVAVTSTANIVIIRLAPDACKNIFIEPQRVINSIVAGRTIFHLRQQSHSVTTGSRIRRRIFPMSLFHRSQTVEADSIDYSTEANPISTALAIFIETHTVVQSDCGEDISRGKAPGGGVGRQAS